MEYKELPLDLMNQEISNPRESLFARLDEFMIVAYIEATFREKKDIAAAFDGAFTALHIETYLAHGQEEDALDEMVGWFAYHKSLKGPFYGTLEMTLSTIGKPAFFQKGVDYLIDRKGEL